MEKMYRSAYYIVPVLLRTSSAGKCQSPLSRSASIFSRSERIFATLRPRGVRLYSTFGGISLKISREIIEYRINFRSRSLRTFADRPGICLVSAPGRETPLAILRKTTTVHLQPRISSMTLEIPWSTFIALIFLARDFTKIYQ